MSNEYYIGFAGAYYHILTFGCIIVNLILYFLVGFALLAQSKAFKKFLGIKIKQDPISVVSVAVANKKAPVRRKKKNAKEIVQVEKTIILPYFMGALVALIGKVCFTQK
jgi:multisubunit Na+/H+ antiporter MnhC subunit